MKTSPGPRNNQQRKRPVTQGGVRAMVAKKDLETVNEVSASSKRNNNAVARRASTNDNHKKSKRRPSTQGGVANNVNVAKIFEMESIWGFKKIQGDIWDLLKHTHAGNG